MSWTAKDEKYKNKLNQIADKETLEWMKEKSKDIERIMAYYRCAMMEIETKFRVLNVEYSLKNDRNPISNIQSRLKSMLSIKEKLDRRGKEISLTALENDIFDIAGIRVVCSFPEDVYEIADAFLKQDDIRLIEIKDYIKNPKPNGYRSLHMIVEIPIFLSEEKRLMKAEIQLRTIAMDFWASLEHQLRYKKDKEFTPQMAAELMECASISAQLDLRMDELRKSVGI